jgi:integrase
MPKKATLEWGNKRLRGRIWWIRYYKDGKHIEESTRSTEEADADKLLIRRYAEIQAGTYQSQFSAQIKVADILDMLLDDYRANEQNVAWAESVINNHVRPHFGTIPLSKFNRRSASLIRAYMVDRQKKGAASASINRERALLRRSFSVALAMKEIDRIPAFPPRFKENNVRQGFFEEEIYRQMREALSPSKRPILDCGYYSLCRKREIESLQWTQVDLIASEVRLEPGTTKADRLGNGDGPQGRTIPLRKNLYQMLLAQREIRDQKFPSCPWVFFNYDTGQRERIGREAWVRACIQLGWATKKQTTEEENRSYQLSKDPIHLYRPTVLFHDLRRTGVRNVTRAGVPEKIVMLWSGHRTRAVFDRYNITNDADLTWAAGKADALEEQRHQAEAGLEAAGHFSNKDSSRTIAPPAAANLLN